MKSKAKRNCRRKSQFPAEHNARVWGSLKMPKGQQWPYQCDICGKWHLTSQPIDGVRPISPGAAGIFA